MANTGNLNDPLYVAPAPFTLVPAAGAVVNQLTLNPNLPYTLAHDSENTAGNSATNTIYFTFATGSGNYSATTILPNFTPTSAESLYPKLKLLAGRSVSVGPGIPALYYAISGNSSQPTFTVAPGVNVLGKL